MLRLPSLGELDRGVGVKIYLCTSPADMRKGFDTLAALVKDFRLSWYRGTAKGAGRAFVSISRLIYPLTSSN